MEVIIIKDVIISINDNKLILSYKDEEPIKILTLNDDNNEDNIINSKDTMIFNEKYIKNNISIVSNFINGLVLSNNIDSIYIENLELLPTIINVISNIKQINKLFITEDKELTFEVFELLLKSKYITHIDCYSLPIYMLDKFDKKGIIVDSRIQYLSTGNFISKNKLYSYSKMYYKDSIMFDKELDDTDLNDFNLFLKNNNNLKTVDIYNFSLELLRQILKVLNDNNVANITINIRADSNNASQIKSSLPFFKAINKMYKEQMNISFKIKYSLEYRKKNSLKQVSMNIVTTCCIIINLLMLSSYGIMEYNDYLTKKNTENINKIVQSEVDQTEIIETENETEDESTIESTDVEIDEQPSQDTVSADSTKNNLTENYEKLLSMNDDTVGWIKVNNTNINYPVIQAEDNDYYLRRGFDKKYSINGWIYMDYRNDKNGNNVNTIIYGHNLRSGMMFGTLKNVLDSTWNSNPDNLIITFNTINKKMKWQIFSVYTIDVTNDFIYTYFASDEDYTNFLNKIKSRSIKDFGVEVDVSNRILTLVTCANNGTKRLAVHAKLID